MKEIKTILACCFACLYGVILSQTSSIQISVIPMFGSSTLTLSDTAFQLDDATHLQIEMLKFYLSSIQFMRNGKVVLEEKKSFHLVDAAKPTSCFFSIPNENRITFDEVKFNLGIDSSTNLAGVMGGDLDPTLGMYWAWQSGYINFKCEGKSDLCPTRKHEFQFHFGGYLKPDYCLQTVFLPVQNQENIRIKFDVENFLNQIDLATVNEIMSPGKEAVMLSRKVANSFSIVKE